MARQLIVLTKVQIEQAAKMAAVGISNDQLADFFEVSPTTWDALLRRTPALKRAIKKARSGATTAMAASLYQRGIRGSEAAAIFWLKTQARWREVSPSESAGNTKKAVRLNYSVGDDESERKETQSEAEEENENEDRDEGEDQDDDE